MWVIVIYLDADTVGDVVGPFGNKTAAERWLEKRPAIRNRSYDCETRLLTRP